jgi:glucose/arabinose dehydrogenase
MKTLLLFLFSLSAVATPKLSALRAAPGWKVSLYASAAGARSLALGPHGLVFVGTRGEGKVYALVPPAGGKGQAEAKVIAQGLREPNGVAFRNGDLYVAEVSRVGVIRGVEKKLGHANQLEPWGPGFPSFGAHGWKFIAFGPDGWLYVPVGTPCNACEKDREAYGVIFRVSPDGTKRELVAKGIRNTVGFDWHPKTGELWFTDNGRDLLGDDVPPDELNHVTKAGQDFGFPYCHGGTIPDPDLGAGKSCSSYTAPDLLFPAHSAALGLRFLRHAGKGAAILVAEHGSWNRSRKIGYQVERVELGPKKARAPFLTGFLRGQEAWGRPVDVLELEDGSVLVSDDEAGAVYRLRRTRP